MMIDASGHDDNCPYAGDPRLKCNCGKAQGKKPRPPYRPVNFANSDSALGAMASDMPEVVGLMDRKVQTLGQQVMVNKEKAITQAADRAFGQGNWQRAKLSGRTLADKREIYSHGGVDFIELAPLAFTSEQDGEAFTITARQSWRTLAPAAKP